MQRRSTGCVARAQLNDARTRQAVEDLVRAEAAKFAPRDYVGDRVPAAAMSFVGHPMIAEGMARLSAMAPAALAAAAAAAASAAPTAATVPVVAPEGEDPAEWAEAVTRASAALEHERARVLNLELLDK